VQAPRSLSSAPTPFPAEAGPTTGTISNRRSGFIREEVSAGAAIPVVCPDALPAEAGPTTGTISNRRSGFIREGVSSVAAIPVVCPDAFPG
jgi:hypothetical protein